MWRPLDGDRQEARAVPSGRAPRRRGCGYGDGDVRTMCRASLAPDADRRAVHSQCRRGHQRWRGDVRCARDVTSSVSAERPAASSSGAVSSGAVTVMSGRCVALRGRSTPIGEARGAVTSGAGIRRRGVAADPFCGELRDRRRRTDEQRARSRGRIPYEERPRKGGLLAGVAGATPAAPGMAISWVLKQSPCALVDETPIIELLGDRLVRCRVYSTSAVRPTPSVRARKPRIR